MKMNANPRINLAFYLQIKTCAQFSLFLDHGASERNMCPISYKIILIDHH